MSPEEHDTIERIDRRLDRLRRRVNINTGIFAVFAGLTLIVMVQAFFGFRQVGMNYKRILVTESLAKSTDAKLQIQNDALMDYIKTTIAGMWDKLQDQNPTLDVPKLALPRPAGVPQPKGEELERREHTRPSPIATPRPKVTPKQKVITKRVYVKKPADWPWWKAWPPKPTPRPARRSH